jgi:polysaccharide pyruvyl transferase WcaK-like protein
MMSKIHLVFANRVNIGDLLSALGIIECLPELEILTYEIEPRDSAPNFGSNKRLISNLRDEIGPSDVVVIGGGGLLHNYFETFWNEVIDSELNCQIFLWGIGICEAKNRNTLLSEATKSKILTRCHVLSVRDQRTASWLSNTRIYPVVECPSNVVLRKYGLYSKTRAAIAKNVLFVLHHDINTEEYRELRQVILALESDQDCTVSVIDNLLFKNQDIEDVLKTYQNSDVVITSRLHGCIIAKALGKPIIAIAHDTKIDEYMNSVGLGEFVLNSNDSDKVFSMLSLIRMGVQKNQILSSETSSNMVLGIIVRNQLDLISLTQQRDELNQQRDELNQQRDELNQQRDELNQQRDELNQQRDELNQQRDEIVNSTIWKLTDPLRKAIDLFKK